PSLPVATSHTRTVGHFRLAGLPAPTARYLPLGEKATHHTSRTNPRSVRISFALAASHSFTSPLEPFSKSPLHVASCWPPGANAKPYTASECAFQLFFFLPVETSHSFTQQSSPPDASVSPYGEKATA